MYPASQYSILYGFNDLPESLLARLSQNTTIEISKVEGEDFAYVSEWLTDENDISYRIEVGAGLDCADLEETNSCVWVPLSGPFEQWTIGVRLEETGWLRSASGQDDSCLIEEVQIGSSFFDAGATLDTFADNYLVEIDTFGGDSEAVIRSSLCEWTSSMRAVGLEYRGRLNDVNQPYYCKWTASFSEAVNAIKQGAQNSPIGTYGPVDLFGEETLITVSEL
jgi:hypothetical protein